jgi:chemotaxis protein methyltransferase CheR
VPELRQRVFGMRHNLAADPPPFELGQCQVVFCRNVLIYFGHDDVAAFIDRLATRMEPSGYLFLGYSESLFQVSERFHLVRLGEAFVYRKGTGSVPPPAPRDPSVPTAPRPRPTQSAPAPRTEQRRARRHQPEPTPMPDPEPEVTSVELLALGEMALGDGDHAAAIAAFRKATYLDVDHPIAHLNLGLALEASGDAVAARRAFVAARAALDRRDSAVIEAMLEGYHLDELVRLLDRKAGSV